MPRSSHRVPKLCGADIELGNFILGSAHEDTVDAASRLLLHEIDGIPADRYGASVVPSTAAVVVPLAGATTPSAFVNPQDQGRKFLPTSGSSAYIDLCHCELATAETLSAYDHVALRHALFRIAQRAQHAANGRLPEGQSLQVHVANSDGQSNAYGSHLSFLVTRRCWENLFERRLHHLLYLAAFQISSIVFTGAGKVGSENGAPPVTYQVAQRADFFETLVGTQTTHRRPIVNARDEALAGPTTWNRPARTARVHSIFFDNVLCHGSMVLGVGVMQIVLAMIEAERVDSRLILDEPLVALRAWSHDPELRNRARTAAGRRLTAVELQLEFLARARRFVEAGGCEGIVPCAEDVMALWADTLERLRTRDFESLVGRLDWVLKREVLRRARARHPHLEWRSPEMKMLDHRYASLDARDGLYWAYERAGVVERLVSEDAIARFEHEPPPDTRAWTRAMLLRLAGPRRIDSLDWDWMRFTTLPGDWVAEHVDLADPLRFTEAECAALFADDASLDDVLRALAARPAPPARAAGAVEPTRH